MWNCLLTIKKPGDQLELVAGAAWFFSMWALCVIWTTHRTVGGFQKEIFLINCGSSLRFYSSISMKLYWSMETIQTKTNIKKIRCHISQQRVVITLRFSYHTPKKFYDHEYSVHSSRSQRTTWGPRSLLLPFGSWSLNSVLATGTFIHWTVLLVQ